MNKPIQCQKCGMTLPPDAPADLCPRCLLQAGADGLLVTSDEHPTLSCGVSNSPSSQLDTSSGPSAPSRGARVRYFGDYELLEEIGRGGMGVVYRARQTRLNRIVALKMILAGQFASESDVRRFQKEAEAAAQLDHPGIVPIFEVGQFDGHHFYSMALIEGESLALRVAETALAPNDAAQIIQKVAIAVQYAHEKGVIHRDLKPANILLGRDGLPRVADFGLAKQLSSSETFTETGQLVGTPCYMSPEQASGAANLITTSSDIYALGALLYAALCARPPFQADSVFKTLQLVIDSEPVPPRQFNRTLPRDLETICLKCLKKSSTARYSTAAELAEDLQRYLEGRPIVARSAGTVEKAWLWCRRNPAVSSLVMLSSTLLVGGASVALYFALWANAERVQTQYELYRNQIMLAERELESGGAHQAREILANCPKQRRGWEWDYIARLTLISPGQFLRTDSQPVVGVAFSRNGHRLVTVTSDGNLNILDGTSLQPLRTCALTKEKVFGFALSPDGQRAFIRTTSESMDVRLDDGEVLWRVSSHQVLALSADGTLAVGGTADSTGFDLDVRKAGTDEVLCSLVEKWDGSFVGVEFDRTATQLRVVNSREALVFDARTGEELSRKPMVTFEERDEPFPQRWNLAATGERWELSVMLASKGMFNSRILIANTEQSERNIELPLGPANILFPQLSSDGSAFAYAINALDGDAAVSYDLFESKGSIMSSMPTLGVLSGGARSSYHIYLYETRTGRLLNVLRGFSGRRLNGLNFDSTGTRLCAWGGDEPDPSLPSAEPSTGEVRIWDLARSRSATVLQGHSRKVPRVGVTNDNMHVLSSSSDGRLLVWNADSGQMLREFTRQQVGANDSHVEVIDDQNAAQVSTARRSDIAVFTVGNNIAIWNFKSGEMLRTIALPLPSGTCFGLTLRDDGSQFAFASQSRVYLYDVSTGAQVGSWQESGVQRLAYDPSGMRLAVAIQHDLEGELKVYRVDTQQPLIQRTIQPQGSSLLRLGWGLVGIAFSPDGQRIVAGGNVGVGYVFDAQTGQPIMELDGHTSTIMCVSISPDGRRIATGSYDNTVRLWDTETGQLVHTFRDHTKPVLDVAFSPDGKILVSGDEDGLVRIWRTGF